MIHSKVPNDLFNYFIQVIYCVLSIVIRDFLVFEIRKNLDLRKILVTPKIFLKSRFHCISSVKNKTVSK